MRYEPRFRPPPPETPPPDAFHVRRSVVRDGVALAYLREGDGGFPLLLLHGYPETKRIWWRNLRPLAAAGFEVIAPDFRGQGDSDFSPGDGYDLAIYSRDRPDPPLPRLRREALLLQHGAALRAPSVRGGRPRLRRAERARPGPDR
jgi:alpha-beta hydrolase superfamily lysophospholipase